MGKTYTHASSTPVTVNAPWEWKVNVQTVVDEDTGGQWIQFVHELKANIKATEEVTFEMAFTSLSNPATDVKERIAEDSGKCVIKLPSTATDKRFWTMTADDAYYKCADYICKDGIKTISTETTKDWFIYRFDNDAYNPFCNPQTDSKLKTVFACKTIKCAHRRLVNTGDDKYDF